MRNLLIKIRNLLLVCLLAFLLIGLFLRLFEEFKRNQLLKKDYFELKQKEKQIEEEIKNLESIKNESNLNEKLEKEARLMLGLKKEGEEVIMIVPPTEPQFILNEATSTKEIKQKEGLILKFKNFWYNIFRLIKRK